jgi:hypothetical protein
MVRRIMRQSKIFRVVYEAVCEALAEEGAATGLFSLSTEGGGIREPVREFPGGLAPARVRLGVSDLCQTAQDKSGQRIIAGELSYETPARFAMTLSVRGEARSWPALLEAMGCAARFFKDNPSVEAADCAWHGSGEGRVFLEPVLRQPAAAGSPAGEPLSLTLYYRVEAALNSEKAEAFRRVQKRDIKTLVK